jgi:hypothetical protein
MKKIFVFGSNLAGIHGAGSALEARKKHGAILGQGIGRQGNSYAIPTKDEKLKTLSLEKIQEYVKNFLYYAENNYEEDFYVVAIGCGLAGWTPRDIAPLFLNKPNNVELCNEFEEILNDEFF